MSCNFRVPRYTAAKAAKLYAKEKASAEARGVEVCVPRKRTRIKFDLELVGWLGGKSDRRKTPTATVRNRMREVALAR